MNKIALVLIITLLLAGLTSCGSAGSRVEQPSVAAADVAATITLTDGGISIDTEMTINNFHPGAKVAVNYKIVNHSGGDKKPIFYLNGYADVKKYESMADGYDNAPDYVSKWLIFPDMAVLADGESAIYPITLEMPDGKTPEGLPGHFAFQIGASIDSNGGYQTAVGQWWFVNLR